MEAKMALKPLNKNEVMSQKENSLRNTTLHQDTRQGTGTLTTQHSTSDYRETKEISTSNYKMQQPNQRPLIAEIEQLKRSVDVRDTGAFISPS